MSPVARIISPLCALAVPLLVQLLWLLHNTQLPISDSTGSLAAAYTLSTLALEGHWHSFLTGLYTIRDWRPTSLCLVLMPFCVISGGSLMFAAAAMTWVSTAISVTYIYFLLRLSLTSSLAALGAGLLGVMPVVQWPATFFGFTETPFLAAMLAAIYHLLRVDDFRDRRQCGFMAASATLAFSLRPIEALLHFVPVLACCVWRGWRRNHISAAEIYATLTGSFVCASILVIAGWWPEGLFTPPRSAIFNEPLQGIIFLLTGSVILPATLLLLVFFLLRGIYGKLADRTCLLASVGGISLATCLFYYRFMTPLVQWIYITNFGELSHITEPRAALQKTSFFFFSTGAIPVTLICMSAAFAALLRARVDGRLLPMLGVIPLPLITPFFTVQYSQRKMTVVFTCMLALLLSLALQKSRWQRLIAAMYLVLAASLAAALAWIGTDHTHSAALEKLIGLRTAYPAMVTTEPNPHDTIVDFMTRSAKSYGYHSIALPILAGDGVPRIADPFLLHILTHIKTFDLDAVFPSINADIAGNYRTPRALFGADAFLVAPDRILAHTPQEAALYRELAHTAWLPSDRSAYEILALHAENKLESLGVHKRACTLVAPTGIEVCLYDYGR